jgi:hypothetical protein
MVVVASYMHVYILPTIFTISLVHYRNPTFCRVLGVLPSAVYRIVDELRLSVQTSITG